jgi:Domain of unknown function (DUF4386)
MMRERPGLLPDATDPLPPDKAARIAGGFYLAFVLASVLAGVLGHIGMGGVDQVYASIVADTQSFRLALVVALASAFLFVMAAWGLYVLLRPVNQHLALLFLLLNAIGVTIQCASMFALISALLQGDAASQMQGYSAAQLQGLAFLSINLYKTGIVTAQLFFGTWLFPLGYLVYRSGFLPRPLGVLLMLDGVGVLIWFLQALLLPAYPAISYPSYVLGFVAEVGLGLWLLIRGVKVVDSFAARAQASLS